jgi:hypothetical protein
MPPLHVPHPEPLALGGGSIAAIMDALGHQVDMDDPPPVPMADVVRSIGGANPSGGGTPHPAAPAAPRTPAGTSVGFGGNGLQVTLPGVGTSISVGPAADVPAVAAPEGDVRGRARDGATPEPPANVPEHVAPLTPILHHAGESVPAAIRPHRAR